MKREANNLAELAEHEALRMLESLEWDAEGMCPVCSKTTDREHTHRDDCPWLALMRKAGLR